MKTVDAVTSTKDVAAIEAKFYMYGDKVGAIWSLGVNVALRISDLLSIKYSDIDGERLLLKEGKTGKTANIKLNKKARKIVKELRKANPNDEYLFQATGNRVQGSKPFSRQYVTRIFAEVGHDLRIKGLGTHSMRKTRGYHVYQKTKDIGRVMKMLRHSSEAVTLRYIGITQKNIDQDFEDIEL